MTLSPCRHPIIGKIRQRQPCSDVAMMVVATKTTTLEKATKRKPLQPFPVVLEPLGSPGQQEPQRKVDKLLSYLTKVPWTVPSFFLN